MPFQPPSAHDFLWPEHISAGKHVLIVGSPCFADRLTTLLNFWGHRVSFIEAATAQAVEMLRPQVVIVEVPAGQTNCLKVPGRLRRSNWSPAAFVAITDTADEAHHQLVRWAGFDEVFVDGCSFVGLRAVVDRADDFTRHHVGFTASLHRVMTRAAGTIRRVFTSAD